MAVRLKQAGYDDFVVLERAEDVGGTWRDNTYPGCRCDVPSHLYSFSFAPNPDWSSTLLAAARDRGVPAAGDRRLRRSARTSASATPSRSAHWDADGDWRIRHRPGRPDRRPPALRDGPAGRAVVPEAARASRTFHGDGLPLRPVEPRSRPERPQGRGDRHRRLGDPVRAGDPAGGRGAAPVPAHPAVGDAAAGPQDHRAEKAVYRRFPLVQRAVRAGIYWGRESFVLGFAKLPADHAARRRSWPSGTSPSRSATPSCATS